MLDPTKLGFPDEDHVARPHVKRPFGKKKGSPRPAASPSPVSAGMTHPANPHLSAALAASDHKTKQKHVFKALGAIRRAATMAPVDPDAPAVSAAAPSAASAAC